MKRRVENWTIEKLHKSRAQILFPEYQRQDRLWPLEKKQLLIDSILRDIDIPKLYFNRVKTAEFEVVDGQQRLWAIWEFLDDEYPHMSGRNGRKLSCLPESQKKMIREYALQITVFEEADDDYLRTLFLRLQFGLLLVTGEKLHAATGAMKDFIFKKLANDKFIDRIKIPQRRYAKETLCAQITINSFTRKKLGSFARTRYEDLLYFFREYERPQGADLDLFNRQTKEIVAVLRDLEESFGARGKDLTNRSYILSVYLAFEELRPNLKSLKEKKQFVEFTLKLWSRLRAEIRAGFDRENRELYDFETKLSSAPGERYQIERRHHLLLEYFEEYRRTNKIKGD